MVKKLIAIIKDSRSWLVPIVISIVVFVIIFIASVLGMRNSGKRKLSDSDINTVAGVTSSSESTTSTSYTYYLDISPTMYGFINGEDVLYDLADIFEYMNRSINSVSFYCCGTEIMSETSSEFYEYMRDAKLADTYYQELIGQAGEDDSTTVSSMELSKLFTDAYDDRTRFNSEDSVNIIITDLNFSCGVDEDLDVDSDALLESFAQNLSDAAVDGSVCIYSLECYYEGFETDEYLLSGTTVDSAAGYSFLLIVVSDNRTAYTSFTGNLEQMLESDGIDISNKFEITETVLAAHELTADTSLFHSELLSTITNFNYDSNSYTGIDSNALGLQLIKNGEDASAQVVVAQVELPGYYSADQETETEIKSEIQLLIAGNTGYEVYQDYRNILACSTELIESDGAWYLQIRLNVQSTLADVVSDRPRYCVVDVQLSLSMPDYTVPEWVSTVNEDSWGGYYDTTSLSGLIERIESDKEAAYSYKTNYEKYMGNIQIYIGC